jgi:hypothetical protein
MPVKLGIDELGSVYGSDATTRGFSAARDLRRSGVINRRSCGGGVRQIQRCADVFPAPLLDHCVEAKTRRRAEIPIYAKHRIPLFGPSLLTVALSGHGAVAWLQTSAAGTNTTGGLQLWATTLERRGRSRLAAGALMIDAGSIDRSCHRPLPRPHTRLGPRAETPS